MPADFFEAISDNGSPPIYKFFNGKDWVESKKVVALIAAYNNEIRLIDNMLLFN